MSRFPPPCAPIARCWRKPSAASETRRCAIWALSAAASRIADPAADYPAALLALEAQIRIVAAHRERTVAAEDFFLDAFTTALEPDEIIVEVQAPIEDSKEGYRYEKVAHPASGFAVVGIAVRLKKSAGKITMARIGVTGLAHMRSARSMQKRCSKAEPKSRLPRP